MTRGTGFPPAMPERRLYVRICGQGRRGGGISPARCAAGDQARRESRRHRDPDVRTREHHALGVSKQTRDRIGITDALIRISVGIEDADDLIAISQPALDAI